MNIDNDYDEDGNNIVPCPICLSEFCLSKEGEKCPEEDEFAKAHESEQKEEWEYEYTTLLGTLMEISAFSAYLGSFHHEKIKDFISTQLDLAEERGRREGYTNGKALRGKEWEEDVAEIRLATITAFVEWAKKYRIFTSTCGHTGDEEKGYQKGLTAGESLFQSELLAFADSLKSNLTQKS